MKTIPLTQGKVAIVDDDAPAWIFEVKWCASRSGKRWYAVRNIVKEGSHAMQKLHRVIMNARPGEDVDHKYGDGLDNRKENLRITTRAENMRGFSRRHPNNISGFRGVTWYARYEKWEAKLMHDGCRLHVGYYDDRTEAAKARDAKARELGWPEQGMNFPRAV